MGHNIRGKINVKKAGSRLTDIKKMKTLHGYKKCRELEKECLANTEW